MKELEKCPVVGILRGIELKHVGPLAEASVDAGLKVIEVTMNTPEAEKLITRLKAYAGDKLRIGAGTVTNYSELDLALKAGAEFIVMPSIVEAVIKECIKQNIPVFPGALTPTEIFRAWDMGATMVKLFPASVFGPKYLKDIRGPFKQIKLMAVGGVSAENIAEFFQSGASAVAFGASIFNIELIESGRYDQIQQSILKLLTGYSYWHKSKTNH